MRYRVKATAVTVALLCTLVLVADAHAVIGRADLDGSNVNQSFVGGADAASIAVSAEHVYWATFDYYGGAATIGSANLDGTVANRRLIEVTGVPRGLAVDDQYIYWSNSTTNSIARANLDGTGVDPDFVANPAGNQARDTLFAVAVDSGHVYWSWVQAQGTAMSQNWIGRANVDGTGVNKKFLSTLAGGAYWGAPVGLAVNTSNIYWSENFVIGRADLDGTNLTSPFLTVCPPLAPLSGCSASAHVITGLAADDSYIYFGGFYEQPPGYHQYANAIGRASVDATGIYDVSLVTALAAEPPSPRGLAVDDGHVYWGRGTTTLKGSASAKAVQKQSGSKIVVKAKVKAKEPLFAQAGGKVQVKKKAYKLKDVPSDFSVNVPAGGSKTLKLKPKKSKDAKKIIKALKKGKKATAKLKVLLSDSDGNTETEKLSIKLKR